jgi:hypothetical protein
MRRSGRQRLDAGRRLIRRQRLGGGRLGGQHFAFGPAQHAGGKILVQPMHGQSFEAAVQGAKIFEQLPGFRLLRQQLLGARAIGLAQLSVEIRTQQFIVWNRIHGIAVRSAAKNSG